MSKKPVPEWRLGALSPSKEGRNYFLPPQEFPVPDRFCNASMREPLDMRKHWTSPPRPGSQQHAQYRTLGTGC